MPVRAIFKDPLAGKTYFSTVFNQRSLVIFDEKTGNWEARQQPLLDKLHGGAYKIMKDDHREMLWFLTSRGLFQYDLVKKRLEPKELFFENNQRSQSQGCVQGEMDNDGNFYFRFANGHVVKYLRAADSLFVMPEKGILGKAKDGGILLLSENGISHLHPQTGVLLSPPVPLEGMADAALSAIVQDEKERYWIGSLNGGIFVLDATKQGAPVCTRLGLEHGLLSEWVQQLALDPDGNIWAGTRKGLAKIDPASLEVSVFSSDDGLLTDNFYAEMTFLPSGEAFISTGETQTYRTGLSIVYVNPVWTAFGEVSDGIPDTTQTPGETTQNTSKGRVAIAAGSDSILVFNDKITPTSCIFATLQTSDVSLTQISSVYPFTSSGYSMRT